MSNMLGMNSGHGHVWDRPDGMKARCGGPALCAVCACEIEYLQKRTDAEKDVKVEWYGGMYFLMVSAEAYTEIRQKMLEAGQQHQVTADETGLEMITMEAMALHNMHEIELRCSPEKDEQP